MWVAFEEVGSSAAAVRPRGQIDVVSRQPHGDGQGSSAHADPEWLFDKENVLTSRTTFAHRESRDSAA